MFNIGTSELILILVLALVIFGPKKLPEIGRAIGSGLKEFRKSASDLQKSIDSGNETGTEGENQREKSSVKGA